MVDFIILLTCRPPYSCYYAFFVFLFFLVEKTCFIFPYFTYYYTIVCVISIWLGLVVAWSADGERLQTAVMLTTTAAGGGPPLAAMLTDLPPHFCTRQLGVTMMGQGSSATLGRGKTRWVSSSLYLMFRFFFFSFFFLRVFFVQFIRSWLASSTYHQMVVISFEWTGPIGHFTTIKKLFFYFYSILFVFVLKKSTERRTGGICEPIVGARLIDSTSTASTSVDEFQPPARQHAALQRDGPALVSILGGNRCSASR